MNLNQVTVPVTDIERSIAFYQQLGLRLIVHTNAHYARFACPDGQSTFSLHLVDELPKGDGIWVYFETVNIDIELNRLIAAGITVEELPNDKRWLWREARLKDPDNNQLILYYAGENRLNPPWRIS